MKTWTFENWTGSVSEESWISHHFRILLSFSLTTNVIENDKFPSRVLTPDNSLKTFMSTQNPLRHPHWFHMYRHVSWNGKAPLLTDTQVTINLVTFFIQISFHKRLNSRNRLVIFRSSFGLFLLSVNKLLNICSGLGSLKYSFEWCAVTSTRLDLTFTKVVLSRFEVRYEFFMHTSILILIRNRSW